MSVIQYASISALVSALSGRLMKREDYLELIEQRTVGDVLQYLCERTHLSESLRECPRDLHRGEIEHLLKQQQLRDYSRIIQFLSGSTRLFFKTLFTRFEVEDVKLLLRTLLVENDQLKLKEHLLQLGHYGVLDLEKLSEISSVEELGRFLEGTGYGGIIAKYMDKYREEKSLFSLEMALDIYYFQKLWKATRLLGQEDRKWAQTMIGTQADLLNIQWIYRVKKFYHIESSIMLGYTLPIRYHLSLEEIRGLIQSQDMDDFHARLRNTFYHDLFDNLEGEEDVLFERNLLGNILHQALQYKIKGVFTIGRVLGYLEIREMEMRDIITILEGVRYGMDKEKLARLTVHDLG